MHTLLRTLSFGLVLGSGLPAAAQGHLVTVAGHMTPCNPAMSGSTVNIHVYGHASGPVAFSTTLNENCYYIVDVLVPDTAGAVFVGASCSNGTFFQDSASYSLTPPFSTDVIIDLTCGQAPDCQACYTFEQTAPFAATFNGGCSANTTETTTYLWDFSSGGTQTGATTAHTFNGPGVHAACLNLSNASGCSSSICHEVYVDAEGNISWDPPAACQACINVEQAQGGGQLLPWVVDLSSCSAGDGPFTYDWYLPNGNVSSEASPIWQFSAGGVYDVCLTITASSGCTSSVCDTIVVGNDGYISTQTPWWDCANELFGTNTVGTPCTAGGEAGTWNANCECVINAMVDCEGNPGGNAMPGTPCQIPGTINTGTWTIDCVCLPSVPIECEADFWVIQAYENGDTIVGEPVPNELWIWNLTSGGNGIFQFLWNFGDGTSSTEPFPSHTYAESGPYLLCLTVTDGTGCTDDYCDSVGIDENGMYTGMVAQGAGHHGTLQSPRSEGFTINVINPLTMSVQETAELSELTTWPNPAQDRLDIGFNSTTIGQVRTEVVDATGRRVLAVMGQLITGQNRITLDVSDLRAGLYMIRIGEGTQSVVRRFVKSD